ncbi:lanthionine synthetase [Actinomadura sp. LD22]|uniref:Lanthionine synthetase n=1 Tax=Actinomadura physcomitrii TaxID=2650748 RepID=A0A6I4MKX5_9ACTN|nr:lanthionine synthetase C family protein [Actinomadura physcomitrii]MWA04617.1 lanthionine synthetase [Actinomadura physcomitrii]
MTSELSSNPAEAIADRLAHPDTVPGHVKWRPWWRQSLAHGAPGIALLHIERAAAGLGSWQRAHDWLAYATRAPLTTGTDSHLYYGAPAIAHALNCAAEQRPGSYRGALDRLDEVIGADARARVDAAHARIDAGRLPALAEFDVIRGLTGIGSHLLRRDPGGKPLRAILEYLVRLTEPITVNAETLPGWWTDTGPDGRRKARFSDGHANSGLAHGIGGPLALLALAAQRGATVDGQQDAMGRICVWLDRWRVTTPTGPAWPYWVNRPQLRAGHRVVSGSQRPGWCYGTAGLARAQQLAALATGDDDRRTMAEQALLHALTNATHPEHGDPSLCHGHAGLAHIAARVAADASPDSLRRLRGRLPDLLRSTCAALISSEVAELDPALLEGAAGIALVLSNPATIPRTTWDACLLVA